MRLLLLVLLACAVAGLAALAARRLPRLRQRALLAFGGALGLLALRMAPLAIPLALFGYGLWRRGAPGPRPAAGRTTSARGAALEMTLDHDSGAMDGTVLVGRFAGRKLSSLSLAEIEALMAELDTAADTDSLSLLLAWIERHRPGDPPKPEPPRGGPMTEAEALDLLGLAPGASREDIREAYARLIRRVHPDLGGSGALAALLNEARDLLDRD